MDVNDIISGIQSVTRELKEALEPFDDQSFNHNYKEGKWSAAQITEHLYLVDQGLDQFFDGPAVLARDKSPLSKETDIKRVFLDFEKYYTAHGPIIPGDDDKNKTDLIFQLDSIRGKLEEKLDSKDPTEVLMGFSHGHFGTMTRAEWGYFIIYHTQRHNQQIRELASLI